MSDRGLKWRGVGGEFDGVISLVTPQVSKVADDIYFMSWPTMGEGGDNVVVNFDAMTVNAHLGGGNRFRLITGVIHCRDSRDCTPPEGDAMQPNQIMQTLMTNRQRSGRAGPPGAPPPAAPLSQADQAAREALRDMVLTYESDHGTISIEVADDATLVSIDGGAPESHATMQLVSPTTSSSSRGAGLTAATTSSSILKR